MDTLTDERKRLTVGCSQKDQAKVHLYISDHGVGIAPENLTRNFEYRFTTKKSGRGFDLHGSAIAASEMGGTLYASSEGGLRKVRLSFLPCRVSPSGSKTSTPRLTSGRVH